MDCNDILDDDKPELNITPLVDIMLVLLAILMVTTPAVIYKEDIVLPDGSKSSKATPTQTLTIRIDKDKGIHVDKEHFDYDEFESKFTIYASKYDKSESVYVYADKNILYGDVIPVFAKIKKIGFTKVSLGTQ